MTRSVGGESLQRACPCEMVQPRQERTLIPIIPRLVQFWKQDVKRDTNEVTDEVNVKMLRRKVSKGTLTFYVSRIASSM